MSDRDVDRLAEDPSIIRNRRKIEATVKNARAMTVGDAVAGGPRSVLRGPEGPIATMPRRFTKDDAGGRDVRRPSQSQGYSFVGPTSAYAFMQNVGVVNDHLTGCFRAVDQH